MTDQTIKTESVQRPTFLSGLFDPVDASYLVYFRVIFGASMFYWVAKTWLKGYAAVQYVQPRMHFSFYGFEWLQPYFGNGTYLILAAMAVCALFMILGYVYRLSSLLFAVGFTYLFLLDKSAYQNHYYLITLVSWIMALMPAERMLSIDAWQQPRLRSQTVPAWTLWLLRFQIAVPYFFGGIAKLSPDWIAGQPMRMVLEDRSWFISFSELIGASVAVQFFVWGGMLFDLLVVPALLWRPARFPAYVASLIFHFMNAFIWNIGVFPWFMIFATVVFFEPDWPRKLLRRPPVQFQTPQLSWSSLRSTKRALALLLGLYVSFQTLVPLRHYVYARNDNWTEEAHCFSWHMLLRGKVCAVRYYATDPKTGRTGTIDLRRYITDYQVSRFGRDPRSIHQLARFVASDLRQQGFPDVEIRALAWVSLNGRKPQLMIDPNVDLGAEPVTRSCPEWILPLTEPLREDAWKVPLVEWEKHLEIPEPFRLITRSKPPVKQPTPPSNPT